MTSEYDESSEYIKLQLKAGEIDIVVGKPLTENSYELVDYECRLIRIETSAEFIAKKMWHRGDQAKARDLLDLCAVATFEPSAIDLALLFMELHAVAVLERLDQSAELAEVEYPLRPVAA